MASAMIVIVMMKVTRQSVTKVSDDGKIDEDE